MSLSERSGPLQRVEHVERSGVGGERGVDLQRLVPVQPKDLGGGTLLEKGAQRAQPVARNRDAGRHRVAAALDDQPGSAASRTSRPRSKPATERPEPVPVPSALKATAKAGRRAWSFSREAISPTMPGCQVWLAVTTTAGPGAAGELGVGLGAGLGQHLLLHRLALAVEAVEGFGDTLGLGRILRRQQPAAQRRVADAAAGVDARPEQEGEMKGVERLADPRHRATAPPAPGSAAGASSAGP